MYLPFLSSRCVASSTTGSGTGYRRSVAPERDLDWALSSRLVRAEVDEYLSAWLSTNHPDSLDLPGGGRGHPS